MYNSAILDDLSLLKDKDEEVLRIIFNSLLKFRERALTRNAVCRMTSLLQIIPTMSRVEKEAMSFVSKLERMLSEEVDEGNEGTRNVRQHACRTLWLLGRSSAPTHLRRARRPAMTREEWSNKIEREWNTRPVGEGLRSRPMPIVKRGDDVHIWKAQKITGEHRRLLLKFLVGKFPIPRTGVRIPRDLIKELATMAGMNRRWSQREERRTVDLIESLRSYTLHSNHDGVTSRGNPH